jgi:hypothetical protein
VARLGRVRQPRQFRRVEGGVAGGNVRRGVGQLRQCRAQCGEKGQSRLQVLLCQRPPSLPGFSFDYALGSSPYSSPPTIPEASTWVMMLAGFAGLGLAGYRRKQKTGAIVA